MRKLITSVALALLLLTSCKKENKDSAYIVSMNQTQLREPFPYSNNNQFVYVTKYCLQKDNPDKYYNVWIDCYSLRFGDKIRVAYQVLLTTVSYIDLPINQEGNIGYIVALPISNNCHGDIRVDCIISGINYKIINHGSCLICTQ